MVQLTTSQISLIDIYKRIKNPEGDVDFGEEIAISSDFQRGDEETGVWSLEAKREYINSLEKNYPTGLISIVKPHVSTHGSISYKVIDGGNRTRTIRDFFSNKFTIDGLFFGPYNEDDEFEGETIGVSRRANLKAKCIAFQTIRLERNDPPTTISVMFTRLNTRSVPLSHGELIKAHGWQKDKPIIEMAKFFIGNGWTTSYIDNHVNYLRNEWINTFCEGKPKSLKETKRCDSMAMMCGYIVSAITGDFNTFDKRYNKISTHLDILITPENFQLVTTKLACFIGIMKEIYIRDIFGSITKGLPSRKFIAPVWYKICDGTMDNRFKGKIKVFFKTMVEDVELKARYVAIRDGGSNGETTIGKMGKIIDLIENS
jgi:hypothetical protein